MADTAPPTEARDLGAPQRKGEIDPELVKLGRARPKIGAITCLGVVVLCVIFILRLNGDRRFGGQDDKPVTATAADIVAGKIDTDSFVAVEIEPLMSHAIRASRSKTGVGVRLVPARGANDKLWLVLTGDGWEQPTTAAYEGRLERLEDLAFADAVQSYAHANPRPVFAKPAAVRAGLTAGKVVTVAGDTAALVDADKIAIDVLATDSAMIVAALNERFPNAGAWASALTAAGITAKPVPVAPEALTSQVRFELSGAGSAADATTKLEKAQLWAARVEPITRHYETTWGALKASPATGLLVAPNVTIADAELDLVGLYVAKGVPDGAYALITDDKPQQYWYVLPISIALVLIGLLFGWVFVLVAKRDFLPTKA